MHSTDSIDSPVLALPLDGSMRSRARDAARKVRWGATMGVEISDASENDSWPSGPSCVCRDAVSIDSYSGRCPNAESEENRSLQTMRVWFFYLAAALSRNRIFPPDRPENGNLTHNYVVN